MVKNVIWVLFGWKSFNILIKIRCLSIGIYSPKKCHKPFGQPPTPPPICQMPKRANFFRWDFPSWELDLVQDQGEWLLLSIYGLGNRPGPASRQKQALGIKASANGAILIGRALCPSFVRLSHPPLVHLLPNLGPSFSLGQAGWDKIPSFAENPS